ncbi:MAG TPA: hypothetical protein DEH02_07180 [Bacteroidales bacterium]|nr:MAG: hypothetical protein A2X01_16020 [Bacteroidetes bacterium GWF2_35_48]HBX50834.1 hypothetical protein [Bacteroidales bacterium]
MKTLVLAAAGMFFSLTAAQAQTVKEEKVKKETTGTYTPGVFIDNNKDGVCDNFDASIGKGKNAGKNFVDENKDGVCDNHGKYGNGKGYGKGHSHGNGHGYKQGNNHGTGHGYGFGYGYRHGQSEE